MSLEPEVIPQEFDNATQDNGDAFQFENEDEDYHDEDGVDDDLYDVDGFLLPNAQPVLWKHVMKGKKINAGHGGTVAFKCKHCKNIYQGSYTRVYGHLIGKKKGDYVGISYCKVVSSDRNLQCIIKRQVEKYESANPGNTLKKSRLNAPGLTSNFPVPGGSVRNSITKAFKTQQFEDVDYKVVRFLCANGIPFNVLRSPYFVDMVSAISNCPGYKAPSYERARTTLLDNEKERVRSALSPIVETWQTNGVSIVSDGWTDRKQRPLINIVASNCCGSMFMYAHDFSAVEKSGKNISEFLISAIENVGPSNVVQVITDNAANCKLAGAEVEKVYPHIIWSPCVVHTLNLIFKDFARSFPWMENIYKDAKKIVRYITNHSMALYIFRTQSKLELLKVAKTRFGSHYITLKRLMVVRENLMQTVVLDAWTSWARSQNDYATAMEIKNLVISPTFWDGVRRVLQLTKPVYDMIKFNDQEGPLIGEVYEGMNDMIRHIKANMLGSTDGEQIYQVASEIVQNRWEKMNLDLHAFAYALTPKFYNSEYLKIPRPDGDKRVTPDQDNIVADAVERSLRRLTSDEAMHDLLRGQFVKFVTKRGRFGTALAEKEAANPCISVLDWWRLHGGDAPELRNLAIKILSQSISSSSAERTWSTYSYIQSVKRNRLSSTRADTLVYIHSNMRLLTRCNENYKKGPFRKWNINPEIPLVDECVMRLEDMRCNDDEEGPRANERQPSLFDELRRQTPTVAAGNISPNPFNPGSSQGVSINQSSSRAPTRGGRGGRKAAQGRGGNRIGGTSQSKGKGKLV